MRKKCGFEKKENKEIAVFLGRQQKCNILHKIGRQL